MGGLAKLRLQFPAQTAATARAASFVRRYPAKPSPAKPRSNMAQVEGSGMPEVIVASKPVASELRSGVVDTPATRKSIVPPAAKAVMKLKGLIWPRGSAAVMSRRGLAVLLLTAIN